VQAVQKTIAVEYEWSYSPDDRLVGEVWAVLVVLPLSFTGMVAYIIPDTERVNAMDLRTPNDHDIEYAVT
jgi:hypothetical protein